MPELAAPLAGIRVLDLSEGTAGGFATKLLAVFGADVLKVERPGTGDPLRAQGPFPGDVPDPEQGGQFLYLNMNKRSVTLSLEHQAGRRAARELYGWADLVVESFRPGQLAEWGLGAGELAERNPRASLVSIAPFGQSGPYRDFRGNEIIAQALGGIMYVTGEPDREPLRIGGEPAAYFAGASAFSGALAAITSREQTGLGQAVDVSQQEGIAVAQMYSGMTYIFSGKERGRQAASPLYHARDGQVGVALRQQGWGATCEMMGQPELEEDPRFATMSSRREHQGELDQIISAWMADKGKEDLYHDAQQRGMAWGYICDAEDLVGSPQYQHREYFTQLDHPVAGTLTYPGMPLRWGDAAWELRPAPLLGEHNAEVYRELLGWGPDDLVLMCASGVI